MTLTEIIFKTLMLLYLGCQITTCGDMHEMIQRDNLATCLEIETNNDDLGACCIGEGLNHDTCLREKLSVPNVARCHGTFSGMTTHPAAALILRKNLISKDENERLCYKPTFDFNKEETSMTFGAYLYIEVFLNNIFDYNFYLMRPVAEFHLMCIFPDAVKSNEELKDIECCRNMAGYLYSDDLFLEIVGLSEPYDPNADWEKLPSLEISEIPEMNLTKFVKGHLINDRENPKTLPETQSKDRLNESQKKAIAFFVVIISLIPLFILILLLDIKRRRYNKLNPTETTGPFHADIPEVFLYPQNITC